MNILLTCFYTLLALFILIAIHEYGHFYFARLFNVAVTRFSIGFGPVLFKYTDKVNTEFAVSLIPLGGYVSMLESRSDAEEFSPRLQRMVLNDKPTYQRIIIALGGPLANILFAFIIFWGTQLGQQEVKIPVVGSVTSGTHAEYSGVRAGQQIVAFNDSEINSIAELQQALILHMGESTPLTLKLRETSSQDIDVTLFADQDGGIREDNPNAIFSDNGINLLLPQLTTEIAEVKKGSPAWQAGLRKYDRIVQVDNFVVTGWQGLSNYLADNPGQLVSLLVERSQRIIELEARLAERTDPVSGTTIGFLGIVPHQTSWPQDAIEIKDNSIFTAVAEAYRQTVDIGYLLISVIVKMFKNEVSVKSIAGPITIGVFAGDTARLGLEPFLLFLALLSINLGIINLLPIPILDGGQVLRFSIEGLCGKKFSKRTLSALQIVSLLLILPLVGIALYNDFLGLLS